MKALPLAALALAATPVLAAPMPELAQVQQHLRVVETMTADFTQTDRNGKSLNGTLTLKRPGRIRFQYQPGVPLLVVGDGKALTMIDYQVKQVSRWPVGDSPLGLLLDPGKDISRFAKVVQTGDANTLMIEGRDPKHPEFGTISVAFSRDQAAPAGLSLQGWSVLDAQGNRSVVRLSGQKFNVAVDDKQFRWRDPRQAGPRG
ncbi:LolA family protein [Sphingomonas quercus]|uniref:Outer membrane lipoprotein carrier protein LolA n=1 Tax=Sphingomonas quercus TaxID=2842451 RepID=A0ABS6BF67_9SPHN|nr:outer membrane lipoprotein carrier protein LolA [Sphingomonas quercus]MBU3076949.1 outer membrane lipoprotein carrier protein LolA [Sphingomonas quercus]